MVLAKLIPKSTFGQTALLIGALLFINQLVSYLSVTHYFISPSLARINSLISNQVSTFFLQDLESLDLQKRKQLKQQTGIEFHDRLSATHAGVNNATYYEFMSQQVSEQLGQETEIRVETGNNYLIWIRPPQNPNIWISIPLEGNTNHALSPLTMFFVVVGALSVIGGWLFVRRLNRPLQALQRAAKQVGEGGFPQPLELKGSTEIIAVSEAFNKMSSGIRRLESDRLIMTAGISHDLRTPLTRIRLSSEMLPDDQSWVKEGIEHDIEDLNAIINQFIDYARQDQHEEKELANINDIIEEIVSARSIETSHTIELKLGNIPRIPVRKIGVKRIVDNLIENAFRYGSDMITVSTDLTDNGHNIQCVIRDFGPGIEEDKLDSLFSPFTQGDLARGTTGSGLGLAIVKRIVESHGGSVEFTNHQEQGLNAAFTLPVVYRPASN